MGGVQVYFFWLAVLLLCVRELDANWHLRVGEVLVSGHQGRREVANVEAG